MVFCMKKFVAAGTPLPTTTPVASSTPSSTPQSEPIVFSVPDDTRDYLRMGISGPSGSGKTCAAFEIARSLAGGEPGRVAVIDTEYGYSRFLARKFGYRVAHLQLGHFEAVVAALDAATDSDVVVIDSISVPWRLLLDDLDTIARHKFGGDSRSAWREDGLRVKQFFRDIRRFEKHVICTMRAETDWVSNVGADPTSTSASVTRIGQRPDQIRGVEYEFGIFAICQTDHLLRVVKDQTGCFQDRVFPAGSPEFGRLLAECGYYHVKQPQPPAAIPAAA
jgi:hypothetical protein